MTSFLLDSNCWMQLIRGREHAQEVHDLLAAVPPEQAFLTDYALHSIGLVMRKQKILNEYPRFVDWSGIGRTVQLVTVHPLQLVRVVEACAEQRLDFDDAYQYIAAELHGLKLVSLDTDFDRTPTGRLTPAAALKLFTDEQPQPQQDA